MATNLVVFDLDGTISVNPEFYRTVYSGTLESLIMERRGAAGLAVLQDCRKNYDGKGELALFALDIPFQDWAERLTNASMELLMPQPRICELVRTLTAIKVIYTGSPVQMATRILQRLGFCPAEDFNLILGWREPELFPVKWACSPLVFEGILKKFSISPAEAWAVGDMWDTDLLPAQTIGMKTAMIQRPGGNPDVRIPSIEGFVDFLRKTL